jgi:transposase
MYRLYIYKREEYMAHYHKRSNIKAGFRMIKGKFGSSLKSKSGAEHINEALCKPRCHNICVLYAGYPRARHSTYFLCKPV